MTYLVLTGLDLTVIEVLRRFAQLKHQSHRLAINFQYSQYPFGQPMPCFVIRMQLYCA